MTEKEIIRILYENYGATYPYMACNTYVFGKWESDFIMISKAGFAYEIEIKRTKSDYKADFKKKKHKLFESKKLKGIPIRGFYFAMPAGMIPVKDIPDYAGLIYLREIGKGKNKWIKREIKKTPKVLSKEKVTDKFKIKLLRSMMFKVFKSL